MPLSGQEDAKRVQLLKEAFPRMTRLTLLVNPNDQQSMHRFIDEAKTDQRQPPIISETFPASPMVQSVCWAWALR
jgi:hypothetical protein